MNMRGKRAARIIVDAAMLVLLYLLMGYHIIDGLPHEIIGAGLFVLAVLHNLFNIGWYKALFKGGFTPRRGLQTLLNLLLAAVLAMMAVSAILVSRNLFAFAGIRGGLLGRRLHLSGSHWLFVLMSIHLGFHWGAMLRMFGRGKKAGKGAKIALRVAAVLIAVYGVFASFTRDFATHLFLLNDYAFWDYSKPAILFYFDLFAIMCLYIGVTTFILKLPFFQAKQGG